MRYKLMYFADSVKVDLDIAGNCETESMRSVAVLVGHKEGKGRETARRLRLRWRGGGGGVELAAWPPHSAPSKPPYYAGYCLAVTR